MAIPSNPSEIAREALRLLAVRRLQPSPENYSALYHEIAGTQPAEALPQRDLKALAASLPQETVAQQRLARRLEQVFGAGNWQQLGTGLSDLVRQVAKEQELPWHELFGDLLREWENKQAGLTVARKREALERVLAAGGSGGGEVLFGRLQGLLKSWSAAEPAGDEVPLLASDLVEAGKVTAFPANGSAATTADDGSDATAQLRDLLVHLLEALIASHLASEPDLAADARALIHKVRTATSPGALDDLLASSKRFVFRLDLLAEDRDELRTSLLKLLQLLIENVGELVIEDHWLRGQIDIVRDIVAGPLNVRSIEDAESRLKEVIFKQSQLKHSLNEARETLKQMLAGFVDHLAEFADSTSDYHDKIEVCAAKISQAEDISELEQVLAEVIRETRIIQLNAQRSRDDLRTARQRVGETELRIAELQQELERASALVRHDQLTGALNRRGLEEAFEREVGRAQRRQSVLCVALLDIDNFKRLNDSLGHDAGDAALIHLASVIRETMRPQDTVARFGGEEFIILLPETPVEDARTAVVRLQRELTRRIFLHNNERQLITFSAGVTDVRPGDTQASATKRADEAMYTAKQAGKNRVLIG